MGYKFCLTLAGSNKQLKKFNIHKSAKDNSSMGKLKYSNSVINVHFDASYNIKKEFFQTIADIYVDMKADY